MEMRIVVPSVDSAITLAERLSGVFGAGGVSLHGEVREVDILLGEDSDPSLLHVLQAVERWLDQAGAGFAELRVGERSYTLAGRVPPEGAL